MRKNLTPKARVEMLAKSTLYYISYEYNRVQRILSVAIWEYIILLTYSKFASASAYDLTRSQTVQLELAQVALSERPRFHKFM